MAVAAGALVGIACGAAAFVPWVRNLEQDIGLPRLFQLRGRVKPPDAVAIVVMDRRAASNIFLPGDPEKFHRCLDVSIGSRHALQTGLPAMPARWPRCLHANLVTRLTEAGARVIAFDVLFRPRPPIPGRGADLQLLQDAAMASAFASSRVVIAQKLEMVDGQQSLAELSPAIANAALGAAPFPVLKEANARVDRFVAFQDSDWATPTLPAIALQAYALETYPLLASLLAKNSADGEILPQPSGGQEHHGPQLEVTGLLIRQLFRSDPHLENRLLGTLQRTDAQTPALDTVQPLRSLIALYAGEGTRLLNFYGPAGTIPTIGYDHVLASAPDALRERVADRVVFVGYAEPSQPEQLEHFPTAFSSDTDLSGVEIAATAFANLLEDRTIRQLPFPYWVALAFLAGLLATVISRVLPVRIALPVMAAVVTGYAAITLHLFSSRILWIPFVLPLFVATPAGMLLAFAWKYRITRRQREHLHRAFSNFIPQEVVDMLEHNAESIPAVRQSTDCGCVATDAANFTPLAESMAPEQLADFLNQYFEALFRPVASHGGFVSDVVGDAMLAIWPNRSTDTRTQMLNALLLMRNAARHFNETLAQKRLRTRFGVDWGPVTLATVGAHRHYEYRAVGDTVNTASRIQELNKKLGTGMLLSRPAVDGVGDGYLIRDLGRFVLRGKSNPVEICELIDFRSNASPAQLELCTRFAECMGAVYDGRAQEALAGLRELQAAFPSDGPTAFYLHMLEAGRKPVEGALKID